MSGTFRGILLKPTQTKLNFLFTWTTGSMPSPKHVSMSCLVVSLLLRAKRMVTPDAPASLARATWNTSTTESDEITGTAPAQHGTQRAEEGTESHGGVC